MRLELIVHRRRRVVVRRFVMVVVRMVVMMVATVMLLMLMAARLIARVARSRRATVVVVLPHREHVTLGHVSTVLGAERPVRADGRRQQVDVRPELVRCLVGGPAVNAPGWRHGGGLRELAERRPDRAVHRGRRAVVAEVGRLPGRFSFAPFRSSILNGGRDGK